MCTADKSNRGSVAGDWPSEAWGGEAVEGNGSSLVCDAASASPPTMALHPGFGMEALLSEGRGTSEPLWSSFWRAGEEGGGGKEVNAEPGEEGAGGKEVNTEPAVTVVTPGIMTGGLLGVSLMSGWDMVGRGELRSLTSLEGKGRETGTAAVSILDN